MDPSNGEAERGCEVTPTYSEEDYIKHLRTIHFALLVLCLALLAGAYLDSATVAKSAINQLNEIEMLVHM